MFQHVLVPLDGSTRAERAIPVAARLARASGGSITLLRVVTSVTDFAWSPIESPRVIQGVLDANRARAADYLAHIVASDELTGIATTTEVANGMPAQIILSAANSQQLDAPQVDTIIMCSHGDTGFKRWALGSVAQKVARYSPVPVLVLHEKGTVPIGFRPDSNHPVRILVALDGSSLAETALTPAAYLSAALSAPARGALHLAQVLRLPSMYEYGQDDALAKAQKQETLDANAYLGAVEQQLREGEMANLNLQVTLSVVVNTDVANTLIEIAEVDEDMEDIEGFKQCDVIAMATHGRSGPKRWVMGSVTERVLGATKLPLLVVRQPKMDVNRKEDAEAAGWL